MNLISKLTELQRASGLYDAAFAAEIGVTRTMWVKVRSGDRRPGRRFLSGVMRRFPTLTDDCLLDLRDTPHTVVASNVTDREPIAVTDGDAA